MLDRSSDISFLIDLNSCLLSLTTDYTSFSACYFSLIIIFSLLGSDLWNILPVLSLSISRVIGIEL